MLQTPAQFGVIKKCILDAHQKNMKRLDDHMQVVRNLCEAIESLFRYGLTDKSRSRDYYSWIEELLTKLKREKSFIHPDFSEAVKSVRSNSSLCTTQGRGRQMIRFLLQRGRLEFLVHQIQSRAWFAEKFYDPTQSVLAHEILVQIFGSLISELGRLSFHLDLDNTEFLDDTWEMPLLRKYELVPCFKLGAKLETIEGHVVVVKLDPGGVAAEDQRIEVGDVIVTMYGQHLRQNASLIHTLRTQHEGKPVPIGVVKARMPDGSVYRPLRSILRRYGSAQLIPLTSCDSDSIDSSSASSTRSFFLDNPWCQLVYWGQCEVGPDGGVHLINQCIMHVLMRQSSLNKPTPVSMELGELGVTVWPVRAEHNKAVCGSKPLFRHSFPQISSCGRRTDNTNYLAYIVGDEVCTVAKHFRCFVFEAVDHAESKYLISGIAQGFDRTHWTL